MNCFVKAKYCRKKILSLTGTCNVSILMLHVDDHVCVVSPLNKNASLENQFRDGCVGHVFPGHRAKIQTQVEIERLPRIAIPYISLLRVVGLRYRGKRVLSKRELRCAFFQFRNHTLTYGRRIFFYTICSCTKHIKHSLSHLFNFSLFFPFFFFIQLHQFFP